MVLLASPVYRRLGLEHRLGSGVQTLFATQPHFPLLRSSKRASWPLVTSLLLLLRNNSLSVGIRIALLADRADVFGMSVKTIGLMVAMGWRWNPRARLFAIQLFWD